jgi:hypothetical protein
VTQTIKCPSFERLVDYLDNRLPEAKTAGVATHLANGCAACCETRDWYQQVRLVAASDDTLEPPQWVLNRATRIFETQRQRPALAKRIGEAIASLIFDSFAAPALGGVRSTETANRQLLYRAGDYSIDLQIFPSEHARAELNGQVLKESDLSFESVSGLKLDIARDARVIFSAVTNEMGEFKIRGIELGVYSLRVQLPEGNITVTDLPVSEP